MPLTERQTALARQIVAGLNLEEVEPEDLDPEAPLFGGGLGLDSIDALELAVIVERNHGVKIADMEVGKRAFASLRALDAYIAEQRPAGAAAGGPGGAAPRSSSAPAGAGDPGVEGSGGAGR